MHDLKHALRMLRSSPVFAATAVLVLTIGIGANVAIFSVVNAVILKPVPYEDPDTLVQLMNGTYGGATSSAGSPARYLLWREQTDVLAQITDLARSFDRETDVAWIVRTRGDPLALAPVIASLLRQVTGAPVGNVQTMAQILSTSISRQRAHAKLMAVFGGAALLLAGIGIYGLMAFSVQQRTHEIGIRMALGAERDRVRGMVIRQGVVLIVAGTAVGLGAAYWLADVLASVLFGVAPRDAAVFSVVPIVLALVAAAAVSIPAHRASRVNPVDALKCE